MAILIPTLGSTLSRMTSSEKRVATLLELFLEDDYYCWYSVPIGGQLLFPDFVILHPERGLLVLEIKNWKLSSLLSISKEKAMVRDYETGQPIEVINPISQARNHVITLINTLSKDPELNANFRDSQGRPLLSYGYGTILTDMTRAEFDQGQLHKVMRENCVICQDELSPNDSAEEFQQRLWQMFPYQPAIPLSMSQIERIRWHIFPEMRIKTKHHGIPNIFKIMDIQQEQLARSLGDGHRIIHGVAGSGKTMILRHRAEYLAKTMHKPILVLCYNRSVAEMLKHKMMENHLNHKVHVRTIQQWCNQQLSAYNIPRSRNSDINEMIDENVQKIMENIESGVIPKGQYDGILIDEGHDFKDQWFRLVVKTLNPEHQNLLVLYDDAQAIHRQDRTKLTFSKVGINARGRTIILKYNYRNTQEILMVAKLFAEQLLVEQESQDEDIVPLIEPISAGLPGAVPKLIQRKNIYEEMDEALERLTEYHEQGLAWHEMAILSRTHKMATLIEQQLQEHNIPIHKEDMEHDGIHVMTMEQSKGLEFPLVCIMEVGNRDVCVEPIEKEAQLLYVAMTRATHYLLMTCDRTSIFAAQLSKIIATVDYVDMNG